MTRTSTLDERLVYGIVIVAVILSYATLAGLAERAGYSTAMAYAWPITVEALAIMAARAATRLRVGRGYAQSLLVATTTISVVAGAASRLLPPGPLPGWAGACVAVLPPLCVLFAPHLAVQMRRDAETAQDTDAADDAAHAAVDADAPDDEPTRHTEPETDAPVVTLTAVPDLTERPDAPADQQRRTPAHAADALFDIDAPAPDAREAADVPSPATVDAARESNDEKWPRALHLLVTRPDMSQRAVAEEVGMSDAALRRRIGPGGRDALLDAARVG